MYLVSMFESCCVGQCVVTAVALGPGHAGYRLHSPFQLVVTSHFNKTMGGRLLYGKCMS